MKRILTYAALCSLILTAYGCRTEEEPVPETGRIRMTFSSTSGDHDTRTGINETEDGTGRVTWSEGDAISIFDGTYNNEFNLIDGAGEKTAVFAGKAVAGSTYTALYPYDEEATCTGSEIKSRLPSDQYTDASGTFGTMLNPAVAVADKDHNLEFKNIAGLIKVTVRNMESGLKLTGIEAFADQNLTGAYTVNVSGDTYSAEAVDDGRIAGVRLTFPEDKAFSDGAYYLTVLPGTYTGMKITATFSDGAGNGSYSRVAAGSSIQIGTNGGISIILDAADPADGYPETDLYQDFTDKSERNILLDFSYAGYKHGETEAPAVNLPENPVTGSKVSVNGTEYTVYNIAEYEGADGTDDLSDRDAFKALLTDIFGGIAEAPANRNVLQTTARQSAKAIIYFPEGNWILHTSDDDIESGTQSQALVILGGDIILKGAGRDKTRLIMKDPNRPSRGENVMYSSPDMLQFKNNSGYANMNVLAEVTGKAVKGSFEVEVSGVTGLKTGDWVCLYMKNSDPAVLAAELYPHQESEYGPWEIASTDGVTVKDLHQIKSIDGNRLTFCEPIMHGVNTVLDDEGWKILEYKHYENVGIEDLTFAGNAKPDFCHHESWEDDGAYKPLSIQRVTDSWIRRVDFESVSEACSVIESANVSVYDVVIKGNRGHAAIRSQASSRVFIGAVRDIAEGYRMDVSGDNLPVSSGTKEITGQYHATGVSKESMGAVLWRNSWGVDGCFESHATQPRATLIDCCSGGWMRFRQGGDEKELPNHLNDLTIWNFNATDISQMSGDSGLPEGKFIWWDENNKWWKNLPVIMAGFHGAPVSFDDSPEQMKCMVSNGTPVSPESLYEAQLQNRLGYVPGWLTALKGSANAN